MLDIGHGKCARGGVVQSSEISQISWRHQVAGDLLLMQREVRHAFANRVRDLCANLCANSAKRGESQWNEENVTVPVTLMTATLKRP